MPEFVMNAIVRLIGPIIWAKKLYGKQETIKSIMARTSFSLLILTPVLIALITVLYSINRPNSDKLNPNNKMLKLETVNILSPFCILLFIV